MLKNICKSLVKKLLLTMKKLKLTLTNLQKQYLMKTLAMNKFTMLMEQFSTGATKNINKAYERVPTSFKNTKHRPTILECANFAGIHKINLAVSGESQHLRILKGVHNLLCIITQIRKNWQPEKYFLTGSKTTLHLQHKLTAGKLDQKNTIKLYYSWTTALHIPFLNFL